MPGGDRTGPFGMGPMTGRAAGFCAGYPVPGCANPYMGAGFGGDRGFGRGGGWGWRNRFYATGLTGRQRGFHGYPAHAGFASPDMPPPYYSYYNPPRYSREGEIEALRSQADYFEGTLEDIKKRIAEVERDIKED